MEAAGSSIRAQCMAIVATYLPTYRKGGSLESDMCDMSVGSTVGFHQSA